MVGMEKSKNQNVFIASLPRSGSTLLGMLLNQNADCFYIGESFYWSRFDLERTICSCGLMGCPILNKVYNEIKRHQSILEISRAVPIIDNVLQKSDSLKNSKINNLSRGIRDSCLGFDELAQIFRKIIKKGTIIDSSANIIIALNLLLNNWKIIILIRHPYGVISSLKNAAIRHQQKIPKDLWCGYVADFFKRINFDYKGNNVMMLKYEDLCNDTENVMKKLCIFLNIDYTHAMLRFRQNRGHIFMSNRMRFSNDEKIIEDNTWQSNLSKEDLQFIDSHKKLNNYCKEYSFLY